MRHVIERVPLTEIVQKTQRLLTERLAGLADCQSSRLSPAGLRDIGWRGADHAHTPNIRVKTDQRPLRI